MLDHGHILCKSVQKILEPTAGPIALVSVSNINNGHASGS